MREERERVERMSPEKKAKMEEKMEREEKKKAMKKLSNCGNGSVMNR